MTPDCARPHIRLARAPARTAAIVIGLMLPVSLWAQDNNAEEARILDWEPIDSIPTEKQNRQCVQCEGRYVDPLADVKTTEPPEEAHINADANSTEMRDNEVILTGGV